MGTGDSTRVRRWGRYLITQRIHRVVMIECWLVGVGDVAITCDDGWVLREES